MISFGFPFGDIGKLLSRQDQSNVRLITRRMSPAELQQVAKAGAKRKAQRRARKTMRKHAK